PARAPRQSAACRALPRLPSTFAATCVQVARTSKALSDVEAPRVFAGGSGVGLCRVFRSMGPGRAAPAYAAGDLARAVGDIRQDLGTTGAPPGQHLADLRSDHARLCCCGALRIYSRGRHLLLARRARADLPLSCDRTGAAQSGVRAALSHLVRVRAHAQGRDRRLDRVLPESSSIPPRG